MPRNPSKRDLKQQVSELKRELRIALTNAQPIKPQFGFRITESGEGGYTWRTWRYEPYKWPIGSGGMPKGVAKTAYLAEIKARKALVPFQTDVNSVTKDVF